MSNNHESEAQCLRDRLTELLIELQIPMPIAVDTLLNMSASYLAIATDMSDKQIVKYSAKVIKGNLRANKKSTLIFKEIQNKKLMKATLDA